MGLALLSMLCGAALLSVATSNKVVCYFTNWSFYRNGIGKFAPVDIDPRLCTHIMYAFSVVENNRIKIWDDYLDNQLDHLGKVGAIRQQNANVKVMLAIGGWNAGSEPFSSMARTSATRKTFIDSVIDLLTKHNYDGLDLDWEYPALRGGIPEDKQNFNLLIKELQAAFTNHAQQTGKPKMLLSAAVGVGKSTVTAAYDKREICRLLDFVNLMQYDIHGSWESTTGHNAPLYATTKETMPESVMQTTTKEWLADCSSDKLISGIPLYGRAWSLTSASTEVGAPGNPGKPGPYVGESGMLSYSEICFKISSGWTETYDSGAEQAIAYGDGQWVSYDNERSIRAKVNFIKSMNLGGAMVWATDLDDFTGQSCKRGKYPLLNAINSALGGSSVPFIPPQPTAPTRAPSTQVHTVPRTMTTTSTMRPRRVRPVKTEPTTTEAPQSGEIRSCPPQCGAGSKTGYLPDACNQHLFYICTPSGNLYTNTCGDIMVYDQYSKVCMMKTRK